MDAHHRRNRYPPPPDPDWLNAIRNSYTTSPLESSPSESGSDSDGTTEADNETTDNDGVIDVETSNAASSSDGAETGSDAETDPEADTDTHKHSKGKLRNVKGKGPRTGGEGKHMHAPRNSKCGSQKRDNFTQLQAYPGQWRSVLEDAKARNPCTATIEGAFPTHWVGLKQAEDCLVEAMASHEGVVEKGTCQYLYIHLMLNIYCKVIILSTNLIWKCLYMHSHFL